MSIVGAHTVPLKKMWIFLFSIIILQSLMPIVGRFISSYLTTYSLLVVVLLILLYFSRWRANIWITKLYPLLLIVVINSIYSISHGQSMVNTVYGSMLSFCPVLIGLRLPTINNKQVKTLFIVMAAGLFITTVTSIYGLSTYPGAARIMATIERSDDPMLIQFEWLNIGGFSFTYILLTVYPMIIGYIRQTYDRLWLKILVILVGFTYYLSAEYMTGLMGFVLTSSLWFVPKNFKYKRLLTILGCVLVLFVLTKDSFASVLYNASASTKSEVLSERFLYMADSLAGVKNTSEVGAREAVLETSYEGFIHSPILGNWHKGGGVGGHSYILDFLSLFGIVGLILLWKSYKVIFKSFIAPYENKPYYSYAVMSFVTAIILSTVNTGNHWLELTLLVPLFLKMLSYKKAQRARGDL